MNINNIVNKINNDCLINIFKQYGYNIKSIDFNQDFYIYKHEDWNYIILKQFKHIAYITSIDDYNKNLLSGSIGKIKIITKTNNFITFKSGWFTSKMKNTFVKFSDYVKELKYE